MLQVAYTQMNKQNKLIVVTYKIMEFFVTFWFVYDERRYFKQKLLLLPQVPFKNIYSV